MGGIFSHSEKEGKKSSGKANNIKIDSTDRAVLDLKVSRDKLRRYKTKLSVDEVKLLSRAKKCSTAGNKSMALGLLKLRKHKLRDVENVEKQLLTVYEMISTISMTKEEMKVVSALKAGKEALESLHKEMSVDDVLKLMDEVSEQNEIEEEISTILTNGIGGGLSTADEAEIEDELDALEKEVAEEEVDKMNFPAVPDVALPERENVPNKNTVPEEARKVLVAS
eukprot:CAMPEP_0113312308 /NCGR_PEP_ID=MMETSP0010_2-20120614/9193_1 /TAXON_ID=216773 ORGANISM="Corethron hystrix, Strain 308" /NCGR_SAMPLE_ID=MMETSP0010_2 /ASSEMBLY_ACC=CAM_ASM_000155 /LENGTH=223 /DNA_ID=CAMNT_0000168113 /DNA_START=114 /DNA_END=785 /DNA_ORIENTATION=+ /assembly_acc=CAM_ASM_000155